MNALVPSPDNSSHQHIQHNILSESTMESEIIQCHLCKKIKNSTRGLKIHQKSCKNNLPDGKNKSLDEVSESNNILIRATEGNTNKISKVPLEEYKKTINETYKHMVFWKKNLFRLPSNSAGKRFVDELTKLIVHQVLHL